MRVLAIWVFLALAPLAVATFTPSCATPMQPGVNNTVQAPPSGKGMACGPDLVCDPEKQYCSVTTGGPVGVPPSYSCSALPTTCPSPPTCECISPPIGCKCAEAERGQITVTCSAP